MRPQIALPSIVLAFGAVVLACRDAATGTRSVSSPSFLVATDTLPGGCDAKQCHFKSQGDAANLNWFDPGTIAFASDTGGGGGGGGGGGLVRFGYVSVSRGTVSSGGATQTFLFFSITECDVSFSFCNTVRGGFGTIPNDDFTVGGKTLQVHTNTSANPDFSTFAGPAGAVDVVWQMNGLFTVRSSGTTERSQPGFREHDVGQSTDVSANASGTVVGLPVFPVNQADISSNRSLTININR